MIGRTQRFLAQLDRESQRVMVPAIVVAEYLQGVGPVDATAELAALERSFFLPAFDAKCAAIASQLHSGATRRPPGAAGDRQIIKADIQIIATAIAHRADVIVTGNVAEFQRLASGRIRVIDVPDVWEQTRLL